MAPRLLGILVVAAAAWLVCEVSADAQSRTSVARQGSMRATGSDDFFVRGRRRAPQVRGYVARRGGYSYTLEDVVNTYGDSRTRYGGISFYQAWNFDRQTPSGPFDHGFFFDSGVAPHGGEAPYQH